MPHRLGRAHPAAGRPTWSGPGMRDAAAGFALRGTFMHAPRRGEIEIVDDAVVSMERPPPGESMRTASRAAGSERPAR